MFPAFSFPKSTRERDLCGREFCPSLPTQSSSIVVYPRKRDERELRLYSAHSASSDSIRQSMMAEEERNREREKDTKNESTAGCSVLALARRSCVYACAHAPLDAPMIHRPRIHFVLLLESLVPAPAPAAERLPCLSLLLSAIYQSIAFSLRYFNIDQISKGARDHTELIFLPQAPIYRVFIPFTKESFMLFARIKLTRSTTDRKPKVLPYVQETNR